MMNLMTVAQFAEKHKAFTAGALRNIIFKAEENGLMKCGGVVWLGRKVLLDEDGFFRWVEECQPGKQPKPLRRKNSKLSTKQADQMARRI